MRAFTAILAGLIILLAPGALRAAETVTITTINWPPYVSRGLPSLGYGAEIVSTALQCAGYAVRFEFVPWARGMRMVKAGEAYGIFPSYASRQRALDYIISRPFATSILGFYKRRSDPIRFTSLAGLRGYSIGVVRGYVNTEAFDQADDLDKDAATSDLMNLKKLLRGRIDLAVMDKHVGEHLMESRLPRARESLVFLSPPLEVKDLHILFSRNIPDIEAVVSGFNAALREMQDQGAIEAIKARHGME